MLVPLLMEACALTLPWFLRGTPWAMAVALAHCLLHARLTLESLTAMRGPACGGELSCLAFQAGWRLPVLLAPAQDGSALHARPAS